MNPGKSGIYGNFLEWGRGFKEMRINKDKLVLYYSDHIFNIHFNIHGLNFKNYKL